jgi:hypothetical protein
MAEGFRTIGIVPVVIGTILAGSRMLEPGAMGAIPVNGFANTILEGHLRLPPEFALNL